MTVTRTVLDGKALDSTTLASGDLHISGWCVDYEGMDRSGENFLENSLTAGFKAFLENSGTLAFHHRSELGIGRVLSLKEVKGKGVWMDARVDYQEPNSPLRYIYNGIKRGSYRNLSCGGFFRRKLTDRGYMIDRCDLTEISVTPVSQHPRTRVVSVEAKSLGDLAMSKLVREADRVALQAEALLLDRHIASLRSAA